MTELFRRRLALGLLLGAASVAFAASSNAAGTAAVETTSEAKARKRMAAQGSLLGDDE